MTLTIPKLSEEDNEEFRSLLVDWGDGYYWESEGWSEAHQQMRPDAEDALQRFFNEKLS